MKDILLGCSRWKWWGWVITFFVFLELFIIFGPLYNFSILFVSLRKEFNSSAALTGCVGSVANGLVYLFSPVAGLLLRRCSHRVVVIAGVIIYSSGLFATSFIPNIGLAFLTFGILPAFGAGLLIHLGPRLLFDWFPRKHKVRAVSLGLLGTSAGMFAVAPLMNSLILEYGWRSTLKIISGGSLVIGIISGIFLAPPPVQKQSTKSTPSNAVTTKTTSTTFTSDDNRQIKTELEQGKQTVDKATDVFCEEIYLEPKEHDTRRERKEKNTDDASLHLRFKKKEENIKDSGHNKKGFKHAIRQVDVWLYFLSVVFAMIGWTFIIINFASFMKNLGFTVDDTSLVLILVGIGEIAGKVATALCGDHVPFLQVLMFVVTSLIGAVAAGFMIFANSLTDMIIISVVVGVMRGILFGIGFSAGFELFSDLYRSDTITNIMIFPWGLGILVGAPLSGGLFDITGNYTLSLLVLLGMLVLSAACAVLILLRKKLRLLDCSRTSSDQNAPADSRSEQQPSSEAGTVNQAYDTVEERL